MHFIHVNLIASRFLMQRKLQLSKTWIRGNPLIYNFFKHCTYEHLFTILVDCVENTCCQMFIKCALCLSRINTFACSILLTQRHVSVINKAELLSSDRLLRLFILRLLTFLSGKANPVFFVSVTAVLERQWMVGGRSH